MPCKRWGQQIALVLGSHSSAVSYWIQLFTWADQPVLLAGGGQSVTPASSHEAGAERLCMGKRSPNPWHLTACTACWWDWLAGWALQDGREGRDGGGIMTADSTYCGDLQAGNSPPGTNLLQGSSFHPFFPAADFALPPLPPAKCTSVLCHSRTPNSATVFNGVDLVLLRSLVSGML